MTRSLFRLVATLAFAAAAAACGGGIEGIYSGKDTGFLDRLAFKSGGKVELTFMGMTKEGTYELEGDKVKITNGGETHIFTRLEDGCIDGGGILGKYCRE